MNRTKLALFFTAFGALTLAPAGIALAAADHIKPGAACGKVGATATHNGQAYRCEQRSGETCPHWHWIYNAGVPKSGRTSWPGGPCPCGTPTPTASPDATPSTPQPTSSASAASTTTSSTPADVPTLPVTGPDWWRLVGIGVPAIGAGSLLVAAARRRRNPR